MAASQPDRPDDAVVADRPDDAVGDRPDDAVADRPDDAVVAVARRVAEAALFPSALATDRADAVPLAHLDLLARAGLYGLAGPAHAGGLDADPGTFGAVVEALAGACLTTTFVWLQHHGLVRALAGDDAPAALRAAWLAPLCRGERRAGVALVGVWPGPPLLGARPVAGGWVLDGTAPWVTGWGRIDVLQLAARGPDGSVAWLLLDAVEGGGLVARRQRLVAADASGTVRLHFAGLRVAADRLIKLEPYDPAAYLGGPALRVNGSLALGVGGRCCRLLGPSPLDAELDACRRALDQAGLDGIAAARAATAELAVRAAATLVVHAGSRSVLLDQHAQRLAREALFLLVFGTRPAIREALLERLAGRAPTRP